MRFIMGARRCGVQPFKPIFGVIGSILPVVYFGGLAWYFFDVGGSVEQVKANGLGPTVLGLTVLGLLFSIPLIVKIVAVIVALRKSGRAGEPEEQTFDADAAVARYRARQAAEPAQTPAPRPRNGNGPAKTFGRKNK